MVYEQQLRTWLENFQAGKLSVAELLDRVTSASYNMHRDSAAAAQELAAAIQLSIWEFQNGDFAEAELRQRLTALVRPTESTVEIAVESTRFDSSAISVMRSVFADPAIRVVTALHAESSARLRVQHSVAHA